MGRNRIKWKPAVKYQAKKAADAEAKKKSGKEDPNFSYRWEHVKAVVKLVRILAKKTDADLDIVEAAAWLHDSKKEFGDDHPIEGAKFAKAFLPTTDFPGEKISAVAYAIEVHSGLWREDPLTNLEAQVLWDADKLTKIGTTAAIHWLGGHFTRKNRTMTTEDVIAVLKRSDFMPKTINSFHTKPARMVAEERYTSYLNLWEALQREFTGKDLQTL